MKVEELGNLITLKEASKRAHLSYATARDRVKTAGLEPRYRVGPAHLYLEEEIMKVLTDRSRGPKPKITKEDAERIIAMRKAGVPLTLIASQFGISSSYVSRISNGNRAPKTSEDDL
jgi:DNA invertase Pin-like site-specific DNA recombinase